MDMIYVVGTLQRARNLMAVLLLGSFHATFACDPAATCAPNTLNTGNYGTGIDRVQLASLDHSHADLNNDGLQNFVCTHTAVLHPGSNYTLTVTLRGGNAEYCRVYIDYNNDGLYTTNELVLNGNPQAVHSTTVNVPAFPPVTGTNIRMRVISDYNPIAGGCNDVDYGEIEDYGILIHAPPCTAPELLSQPASQAVCNNEPATFMCDATGPSLVYQWYVNGGAGFVAVTNGGIYTGASTATLELSAASSNLNGVLYRCHIANACGTVTTVRARLTILGANAIACVPTTINTGNFGTGIVRVQFNTLDHAHNDESNDGAQDFVCSNKTLVQPGSTHVLTVTTHGGNPEYCRVYMDYNNDATFAAGEMVYNSATRMTSHSTTFTIPSSGLPTDTVLRMRVISDFVSISSGCANVAYGEVEDYGFYVPSTASVPSLIAVETTFDTNYTLLSSGPISDLIAEYTTNLLDGQSWQALTNTLTTWDVGTNITTFGVPADLPAIHIRLLDRP
jgi:hypothetical protein